MDTTEKQAGNKLFMRRTVEASIRIGFVFLLVFWCFHITRPFIGPIVRGILIAVAVFPLYRKLESALNERSKLAATLFTLLALTILIVPTEYSSDKRPFPASSLSIPG